MNPTEKSSAVGNAAAMREALEALNRIDTRGLKRLLRELVESDIFDGGQINKTISAVDKAKAALNKPLRNCDLYNDVEDSWQDYKQFRRQTGEAIYFDMVHFWPFAKWLLAPATEQKGESDAGK